MNAKTTLTKKDVVAVFICVGFLLANLGAINRRGRAQAKVLVCQSNLQKWGQVFWQFAQDNDDELPQSYAGGDVNWQDAYWLGATLPYYGSEIIRSCPMAKPDMDIVPAIDNYGGTFEAWGPFPEASFGSTWYYSYAAGSYGFNDWCACPPEGSVYWGFPADLAWKNVTVEGAENIPLLLDSVYVDGFVTQYDMPPDDMEHEMDEYIATWSTNAIKFFCIDRHDGGINGVFLDMSVRKVGLKELWTLKWHREFDTAGPWTLAGGVLPSDWPEWLQGMEDY